MDVQPVSDMRRYLILIAAVMMQMCLGSTYAWAVFVLSMRTEAGLDQGPVQLPFTMFYIVFPATLIFSGLLITRFGPRMCAAAGGVLFGGGWMLASLGDAQFAFTVIGVGVLGGLGVGLAYLVPVTAGNLWFPKHRGLVTGIALAGFGGGAALVSQIAGYLINVRGATAFDTFFWFGIAFFLIVTLAGLTIRFPQLPAGQKRKHLPVRTVTSQAFFWLLLLTMFTGLMAGFTVNANMTKLYQGSAAEAGVAAVALFAIANALGRIGWGLFFDRVRATTAVKINLFTQGLLFLAALWLLDTMIGFQLFAVISGFNYGGLLVLHASTSARHWGPEHVGQVYGWLSSANIPAAIAPVLAGMAFDRWGSFNAPLAVHALLLIGVAGLFHWRTRASGH